MITIRVWFDLHAVAASGRPVVDVVPRSYLPGVTRSVHITCRPPATEDIAQVLTLQLKRLHEQSTGGHDTVATYATSGAPVVAQPLGVLLNAHVSGSYDTAHPHAALLRLVAAHFRSVQFVNSSS